LKFVLDSKLPGSVLERQSQRAKAGRAQVEAALRMQNPHMHHGAWVAAIVAFSTLVNIEMDKHRTSPLSFAGEFLDLFNYRST
jgi:hypothetical protein